MLQEPIDGVVQVGGVAGLTGRGEVDVQKHADETSLGQEAPAHILGDEDVAEAV